MFSLGSINYFRPPIQSSPVPLTEVTAKTAMFQNQGPPSIFSFKSLETTAIPGLHQQGPSVSLFSNNSGGGGGGGGSGGGTITFA